MFHYVDKHTQISDSLYTVKHYALEFQLRGVLNSVETASRIFETLGDYELRQALLRVLQELESARNEGNRSPLGVSEIDENIALIESSVALLTYDTHGIKKSVEHLLWLFNDEYRGSKWVIKSSLNPEFRSKIESFELSGMRLLLLNEVTEESIITYCDSVLELVRAAEKADQMIDPTRLSFYDVLSDAVDELQESAVAIAVNEMLSDGGVDR